MRSLAAPAIRFLTDARRGAIELARAGVTFEQAAIEWLRWGEHERSWKRSTRVDRRTRVFSTENALALREHVRARTMAAVDAGR